MKNTSSFLRSFLLVLLGNVTTLALLVGLFAINPAFASQLGNILAVAPSATTMNYQCKLTNASGVALSGSYTFSFSIYDAPTGGNVLWGSETHNGVSVSNGLCNVALGSQTSGGIPASVFGSSDRYLQVTINGETLSPRELVRSSAISEVALNVPNGSITAEKLGVGTPNLIQSGFAEADMWLSGWTLHTGSGDRTYRKTVVFPTPFSQIPQVTIGLTSIDADTGSSATRVSVFTENITTNSFDIVYRTWHDSVVYELIANWIAIGSR